MRWTTSILSETLNMHIIIKLLSSRDRFKSRKRYRQKLNEIFIFYFIIDTVYIRCYYRVYARCVHGSNGMLEAHYTNMASNRHVCFMSTQMHTKHSWCMYIGDVLNWYMEHLKYFQICAQNPPRIIYSKEMQPVLLFLCALRYKGETAGCIMSCFESFQSWWWRLFTGSCSTRVGFRRDNLNLR